VRTDLKWPASRATKGVCTGRQKPTASWAPKCGVGTHGGAKKKQDCLYLVDQGLQGTRLFRFVAR
jgi:hypothetical protein